MRLKWLLFYFLIFSFLKFWQLFIYLFILIDLILSFCLSGFCFHSTHGSGWLGQFRKVLLAKLCKFVPREKSSVWSMVQGIFYSQYDPVNQQKLHFSHLPFPRFAFQSVDFLSHSCFELLNKRHRSRCRFLLSAYYICVLKEDCPNMQQISVRWTKVCPDFHLRIFTILLNLIVLKFSYKFVSVFHRRGPNHNQLISVTSNCICF